MLVCILKPSFILLSLSLLFSFSSTLAEAASVQTPIRKTVSGKTCPPSAIIANYWPSWGSATTQSPAQVPWKYSDITFWFAAVTTQGGFKVDQDRPTPRSFARLARAKGSRPILTIGGWGAGVYFSDLVATPKSRKNFASQITKYIRNNDLDGVDIDWEYPASQTGCDKLRPEDTANYLLFLQTLRAQLGPSKIISAAVATTGFKGPDGQTTITDASGFAKVLDYLVLMAYDLYGGWSSTTGPHSQLYATCSPEESASGDYAVNYWTKAGFSKCQLILGIPAYAHSFTTVSSKLVPRKVGRQTSYAYQTKTNITPKGDSSDVLSTPGKDSCGNETPGGTYNGIWKYKTMISEGILRADGKRGLKGYQRYYDSCSQTPFLFNPTTKGMIVYDDAQSVAAKSAYASKQGLAGIAIYDSTGFDARVYKTARANL